MNQPQFFAPAMKYSTYTAHVTEPATMCQCTAHMRRRTRTKDMWGHTDPPRNMQPCNTRAMLARVPCQRGRFHKKHSRAAQRSDAATPGNGNLGTWGREQSLSRRQTFCT